jgi:hypothetical protein
MAGGADWEQEIGEKLRACDVFLLLVSRHSLSSDHVVDREIAIIRERQANGETVHFYPLVLTPTPKIALDLVRDKNLRPRDGKPLSEYSLHERYGHMNEAANEIASIMAKIGARTGSPAASLPRTTAPEAINGEAARIKDRASLEAWLRKQPREVAATIAARVALRVAPLIGGASLQLGELTGATFRAIGLAWAAGKYPAGFHKPYSGARSAVRAARTAATTARVAHADRAAHASHAAGYAASTAYGTGAARAAARAAVAAGSARSATAVWPEVFADAVALSGYGAAALADRPLWSIYLPVWAAESWTKLQAALPRGQNWDVWIDWYEDRLRGGSRGADYELVFASVPQAEWDKGPAAANAWIKAHLPTSRGPPAPPEFPQPLPGLDAPFAYGWTVSQRVAIIAGAQNLPFYPHFSSEEDHRQALESCRVGGERLLKALRVGRYNARREYGEALEYYLNDLPKTRWERIRSCWRAAGSTRRSGAVSPAGFWTRARRDGGDGAAQTTAVRRAGSAPLAAQDSSAPPRA